MTFKTDTMPVVAFPVDAAWAVFRDFEPLAMVHIKALTPSASVQIASGTTFDPDVLGTPLTLTFPQAGVTQSVALPVSVVSAVATGTVDLTTLVYGGAGTVDTKTLLISLDGASTLTVTFAAPANAAAVVSQINAVTGPGIASLGAGNKLLLTSRTVGLGSSVNLLSGTALAGLGFTAGMNKAFAASPMNRATRVKPLAGQFSVTWTGPSEFTTFMSAPYQTSFNL